MMERCTIIGVDCATDPKNVGLARGIWQNEKLQISDVANGQIHVPLEIISDWIHNFDTCLLMLDAPLGWAQDFGRTLAKHNA